MADIPGKRLLAYDHHVTCVRYSIGEPGVHGKLDNYGRGPQGKGKGCKERGVLISFCFLLYFFCLYLAANYFFDLLTP